VILLGLLLVLLAAGLAVWLVLGSQSINTPVDLHTAGVHISFTPLFLLAAGAAILLLFWLGLALIRGSVRRRRRPAREAKETRRQAEIEENIRADERSRAEETHQSMLAERDRVRDEEYQARLTQRDEERDAELSTRQAEEERRIRADERARVEAEFRERQAGAPGHGSAVAAGAGAAAGAAAVAANDHGAAHEPDGAAQSASATTATMERRQEAPATDDARSERRATQEDSATESGANGTDASGTDTGALDGGPAEGSGEAGRHRTVADKLMGRGPTGQD
jgi:hypothetical protein